MRKLFCGFFYAVLFALASCEPVAAATVTGTINDVTENAYLPPYIIFIPKSTPLANGNVTILDVPRSAREDTNGNFSINLAGGFYQADFGAPNKKITILVPPNDTNAYTFNYCAALATNLAMYSFQNFWGQISTRVLPGNNTTFTTNNPGTMMESVSINSIGGNGGSATNAYQLAISGGLLSLQTNATTFVYTIAGVPQTNANMALWGATAPNTYSNQFDLAGTGTNAVLAATNAIGLTSQKMAFLDTNVNNTTISNLSKDVVNGALAGYVLSDDLNSLSNHLDADYITVGTVPLAHISTNVVTYTNFPAIGQMLVVIGTNASGQLLLKGTNIPPGGGGSGGNVSGPETPIAANIPRFTVSGGPDIEDSGHSFDDLFLTGNNFSEVENAPLARANLGAETAGAAATVQTYATAVSNSTYSASNAVNIASGKAAEVSTNRFAPTNAPTVFSATVLKNFSATNITGYVNGAGVDTLSLSVSNGNMNFTASDAGAGGNVNVQANDHISLIDGVSSHVIMDGSGNVNVRADTNDVGEGDITLDAPNFGVILSQGTVLHGDAHGATNLNPATAFPTPLIVGTGLKALQYTSTDTSTGLVSTLDGSSWTNLIKWTHEGTATNITITFNGTSQIFTCTNGPSVGQDYFIHWAGGNGSASFRFVGSSYNNLHFDYVPTWISGSNSVITNGVLSFTSYGGTNAAQIVAAMKEKQ